MSSYFVKEYKIPKYDVQQRKLILADMKVDNEIFAEKVIDIKVKDEGSHILFTFYVNKEARWSEYD